MLSPAAYQLLSDPAKVSPECLQFFIRLLADLDLHKFRIFRPAEFAETYAFSSRRVNAYVGALHSIGILEEGPEMEDHTKSRSKGYLSSYRVAPKWWMTVEEKRRATEIKEQEQWLEEVEHYTPPSPPLPSITNDQGATSGTPCNDMVEDQGPQLPAQFQEQSGGTDTSASLDSPDKSLLGLQPPSNEPAATSSQRPSSEPPEDLPISPASPSLEEQTLEQAEEELERWLQEVT